MGVLDLFRPTRKHSDGRVRQTALPVSAAVDNPLGRQMIDASYVYHVGSVFRLLAHWRATRLVLLAESYRRRKGQPAPSLSDLDLAGDDMLTVDPFSGEAFGYDAARGLLWSVGMDAVNDGGQGKPVADDLVWAVAPRAP